MPHANLDDVVPTADATDPEGFRALMARVGGGLGAEDTGASLYVLPPGQATAPYHYEYAVEEWALVLSGRPTVRTPEGSEVRSPMDLLFFPRGPLGAHRIQNDTDEEARVLMWSNVVRPSVSAYPDSGKIGITTGFDVDDLDLRRADAVDYWDGEADGRTRDPDDGTT